VRTPRATRRQDVGGSPRWLRVVRSPSGGVPPSRWAGCGHWRRISCGDGGTAQHHPRL